MEIFNNISWFFRRIKRVISFLPIIWKGYDFDYIHAVNLFHYQLQRTANYLDSDKAYSVSGKKNARRLRTILELMKKVYDEEYRMEHFDQMKKMWGDFDWEWENNNNGSYTYKGIKWKFAHTPEQQEEAEKQYSELALKAEQKHQRAKKLLWKLIEHNLEHMCD